MFADRQALRDDHAIARTGLAGVGRIGRLDVRSGAYRLDSKEVQEHVPCGVRDGLRMDLAK